MTNEEFLSLNRKIIYEDEIDSAALLDFAKWVAQEIFRENYAGEAFAELACRQLNLLGIVKTDGENWIHEIEE